MLFAAALLTALMAIAATAPASAHVEARYSQPAAGAVLATPPPLVMFTFDADLAAGFTPRVVVTDPAGRRVALGPVTRPRGERSLAVRLPKKMRPGTYLAAYDAVSSGDGHRARAGIRFSIGRPTVAPVLAATPVSEEELAPLFGDEGGDGKEPPATIARELVDLATALTVGAIGFLLLVWLPALRELSTSDNRWRRASEGFALGLRRLIGVACAIGTCWSRPPPPTPGSGRDCAALPSWSSAW
jgi:methionine-rich copper-binding protein CopC